MGGDWEAVARRTFWRTLGVYWSLKTGTKRLNIFVMPSDVRYLNRFSDQLTKISVVLSVWEEFFDLS